MSAMPGFDPVGRYVMLIPTALCVGNGLGAAIGGSLMEGLGAGHAFAFAAGCCVLSATIAGMPGRQASSPAAAGALAPR